MSSLRPSLYIRRHPPHPIGYKISFDTFSMAFITSSPSVRSMAGQDVREQVFGSCANNGGGEGFARLAPAFASASGTILGFQR